MRYKFPKSHYSLAQTLCYILSLTVKCNNFEYIVKSRIQMLALYIKKIIFLLQNICLYFQNKEL